MDKIKPFLKWAGGKISIVPNLKEYFPIKVKRYIEPFLGAGSVLLNVEYPSIANDSNIDLINVWKQLKTNRHFIKQCEKLFIDKNNDEEIYYKFRKQFNETRSPLLFIYLNRHCFNGLCRYNSKNGFNVPFGRYTKPYFPEKELIYAKKKIQNCSFISEDFRSVFKQIKKGDLVYCDPPYVPKSSSSNFTSYTPNGFSDQDQLDLAQLAEEYSKKGATIIISNHYNTTTKKLYKNAQINKINVKRTISSKINKRNSVEEIIAVY